MTQIPCRKIVGVVNDEGCFCAAVPFLRSTAVVIDVVNAGDTALSCKSVELREISQEKPPEGGRLEMLCFSTVFSRVSEAALFTKSVVYAFGSSYSVT